MGTPDFAVPSLRVLINGPDRVVGVVCQPDRKRGRGRKLAHPPIKVLALEHKISVLQPERITTSDFFNTVQTLAPDLIVVVAYGKMLPGSLLNLPRYGAINVHGSLLPKYRGAAPVQWAILNGEQETGVTVMQMDEGMDTGDILYPVSIAIEETDTTGSLCLKLAEAGATALIEAVDLLKQRKLAPLPQDNTLATSAPMLTKEQGHIDWSQSAQSIHCTIRGLDPWPSAYSFLDGKRFRFFHPERVAKPALEVPGSVCQADANGLLIATGTEYLRILELQPEGKKRMDVQACLCGNRITPGSIFS